MVYWQNATIRTFDRQTGHVSAVVREGACATVSLTCVDILYGVNYIASLY